MTSKELRVIRQEAQRAIGSTKVETVPEQLNAARVFLPMKSASGGPIYFFVVKRLKARKFSLILHVDSIGILAVDTTLVLLQEVLQGYGLLLSQDAVIMEENTAVPLSERMRTMAQALIGIDGIRRLWQVQHDRRVHAEGKNPEPAGDATNNSASR